MDTSKQLRDRRPLDNRRVKARLIDWGLVIGAVLLIAFLADGIPRHWILLLIALEVIYFFVCEATTGYTLGKYWMGLRVIKPDGSPPGTNAIAARNIIRVIEEPLLALLVMFGSGGRRQRIGDFVGSTAVGSVVYSEPPRQSAGLYIYPALWLAGAIAVILLVAEPHDRYIEQVNRTCASYAQRAGATPNPTFEFVVRNAHEGTEAIAAIDPPAADQGTHEQIVALYRQLDAEQLQALDEVHSSPRPADRFQVELAQMRTTQRSIGYQLYQLGVDCRP